MEPIPPKRKPGNPNRKPPDKKDIERAMRNSLSNKHAARYLGISYPTYKKYASLYTDENGVTYFDKHMNINGVGVPKIGLRKAGGPTIWDILSGVVDPLFFSPKQLKRMLLEECVFEEKCCRCGFDEKRVLDQKVPLLLNFIDGNKRRWRRENIEFLCYNCYFLTIGEVFEQKQLDAMEDHTVQKVKAIDFELPPQIEQAVKQTKDPENRLIYKHDDSLNKPEDFGDDLIVWNPRRK